MRDRAEYRYVLKYRYGCNDQFETWAAMNSCVTIIIILPGNRYIFDYTT